MIRNNYLDKFTPQNRLYTQLNYIQSSTCNEYINTLYIPPATTEIDAEIYIPSSGTHLAYSGFFGVRDRAGSTETNIFSFHYKTSGTYMMQYHRGINTAETYRTDGSNILDKWINFKSSGATMYGYDNGSLVFSSTSAGTGIPRDCNYPIFLFAINGGGSTESNTKGNVKIKNFKILNNNTIIKEFIPAISNTDIPVKHSSTGNIIPSDTVGMWEKVEEKFYPNAGTGEFIYE